jgi:hypothetical protein
MRDATDQFHVTEIDPHELVRYLISTFHKCTSSGLDRIDIPEAENPTLRIFLTSSGQIQKIEADLTDQELKPVIAKLEALYLGPTRHQVRRSVGFADAPVTGTWECKAFTITAAPPEAPRPQQYLADHPYILEVPIEATGDVFIDMQRADRLRARYELLLSLFAFGFKTRRNRFNVIWGLDMDAPRQGAPIPHLVREFYSIPSLSDITERRTPLVDPLIKLVPDGEYFSRLGRRPDCDLDVPQSLEVWINAALSCNDRLSKRLLRSAYWLRHAHEVNQLSQSAALVAAVQAVEALLPAIKGQVCSTCEREIGPGPTKKFRDFLQEHAPTTSTEERRARDLLYKQRSRLTHGHELLASDSDYYAGWTYPAHAFDSQTLYRALRLAQISAINWFIGQIRSTATSSDQ